MIAAGIDCYQAIQPEEDIAGLRATWGHQLALWGGVSTHTLVMGTPEQIREEVRYAVKGCAPGGGYIMGASHSVCVGTKPENYLAALDELGKVGDYPIRQWGRRVLGEKRPGAVRPVGPGKPGGHWAAL